MADDRIESLDGEQLAGLARYFDEEVMSATNYKTPRVRFRAFLNEDGAEHLKLVRADGRTV
jgi:hypothetical protein